ncbi:MAG: hypothetical protein IC227_05315 [Enterococcus lacertideformus]|uniref:Uncharacterized protein n=1 Tax=Enterococcus lacertideformus TaxID=2771493 RepID=A0A931F8H9_9ENTE|nr:hypothetical protein [Enterococcus lacertideformus]
MKEIRRKYFRFPAYDDETGVKLKKNQRRVLFDGHDDLLTETNDQPLFEQMQEFHFAQNNVKEQRKRRNLSNSKKTTVQRENLVRHKEKLPDYHRHQETKQTLTTKRPRTAVELPSDQHSPEKYLNTKTYETRRPNTVKGRSYFVPKYVPASIIPDPKAQKISEDELVNSMKKKKDSYLLFDNEPIPYQEKKTGEFSLTSFETEKEALSQRKKGKKQGVLEKSLQGLIEDQGNSLGENSYFK